MRSKALILLICAMLLMTATSLAEVKKTEVVYATLDHAGATLGVYIVNSFESDAAESVVDRGDYTRVENLSGTEPLIYSQGEVALQLQPGRFSYQGDARKAILPWEISLAYQLDGVSVPAGQLSGATGELEIQVGIRVLEGMQGYARGSTLQVSLALDADKCLQVDAPQATLARAGGDLLISYVILPGQEANYTLHCQVKDFAMKPVQIAGTRMAVDKDQYLTLLDTLLADSPMRQAAGPMMENFLRAMEGTPPQSFADAGNGTIDSLQFVFMTPEIPPAEKEEQPAPEPEAGQQTFISRLLALFRR